MRIIQILTTLSFGDAVGNDTLALDKVLKKSGYKTGIYAENIDSRLPKGCATHMDKLASLRKQDLIIYHLSTGTKLNYWIKEQECRKIMIYHNITPPHFFAEYDLSSADLCERGLREVEMLKDTFDCVYADSEFNKNDLIKMGYKCPINVLPILVAFEDYSKSPNKVLLKKYSQDDFVNIVFVGRIAPNKKHEDIIKAFYYYHKFFNAKSRLFLVGSYRGMEQYYDRLKTYVKKLEAENVYFTGHVKFDEILSYYHLADLFLCMSEHEGFCVPLIEAMFFRVPIVAYDKCAVKGTLGGSGFLVKDKNSIEIAMVINRIFSDSVLRKKIIDNQTERLKDFKHELIENVFMEYIKDFFKSLQETA